MKLHSGSQEAEHDVQRVNLRRDNARRTQIPLSDRGVLLVAPSINRTDNDAMASQPQEKRNSTNLGQPKVNENAFSSIGVVEKVTI